MSQVALLNHLFGLWDAENFPYVILRNYEDLPEHTGNDIDILIVAERLKEALRHIAAAAEATGWRIHNTATFACFSVFLHHEETLEQVHLDLMTGIKWHALSFADETQILSKRIRYKSFYIPCAGHEAAVNLLTRLIYGGYVKEKYKSKIQQIAQTFSEDMQALLQPWIGDHLAEELTVWAQNGQWEKIEKTYRQIRKYVLLENLKKLPGRTLLSVAREPFRLMRRFFQPPGVCLVFFGPDGCGKSSVANGLKKRVVKTFYPNRQLHCHWKPVAPKSGVNDQTVKDPHGQAPRNKITSLTYFAYHCLFFLLGWWRYVRPTLFRNGLVIIDRYYYDFFVDLRRYRLNIPRWLVAVGYWFIGKPHLVFCLDAPTEILQARKQEVPPEETERQRRAYRTLVERLPNGYVIDASQPLDQVVTDVERRLFDWMAKRTAKRLKW